MALKMTSKYVNSYLDSIVNLLTINGELKSSLGLHTSHNFITLWLPKNDIVFKCSFQS